MEEKQQSNNVHKARPMVARDEGFFDSPVDIIIPFHGQYDKVAKCIESIFRFTTNYEYKITLVDDASKNQNFIKTLSELQGIEIKTNKKIQIIQCLKNHMQLGFVGSLEVGYNNTVNNWIVFMNSDVEVQDVNWLGNLKSTMFSLKGQGVKLVSAKNTNPCGHEKMKCPATQEDYILDDGYVSLECVLLHRDLFRYIGGFLKNYFPGWYEDEELAYRMRHFKFKQAISGKCCVFHHGQATINEVWREKPKFKRMMETNRAKCVEDIKILLSSKKL
jgi:GT2 family glycosyltransferase